MRATKQVKEVMTAIIEAGMVSIENEGVWSEEAQDYVQLNHSVEEIVDMMFKRLKLY